MIVLKIKGFFTCVTAGILMAVNIVSGVSAAAAEETNYIAVLGDSVATGYGLAGYSNTPDSGNGSFGSLLWAGSTDYKNFAADGRTAGELLSSLEDEQVSEVLKKADTAVISVGGNDLLKPFLASLKIVSGFDDGFIDNILNDETEAENIVKTVSKEVNKVDLEAVGDTIDSILQRVRIYNPGSDVYILTVYDAFDPIGKKYGKIAALSELADSRLTELNGYIKKAAENNGVNVVDIHSAFAGHAEEYTNINELDIHPNKMGHRVICNELLRAGIKQVSFSQEKYEWFRNLRKAANDFSVEYSQALIGNSGRKMYEIDTVMASETKKNTGIHAFVYSDELLNDNDFKIKITAYTKDGTEVNSFEKQSFNIKADGSVYGAAAVSASVIDFPGNTNDFKLEDIDRYTAYLVGDYEDGRTFKVVLESFKIPLQGDISDNGEIDLYDAIEIAKVIIGVRKLTADEKMIADFNGDGKVDLYDAIGVAKYILTD